MCEPPFPSPPEPMQSSAREGNVPKQSVSRIHLLTRRAPQGDAELVYGAFRNKLPPRVRDRVYAATKWCVFGPVAQPITEEYVLDAVRERCRRLGGRVELLQFHWYDVGTTSTSQRNATKILTGPSCCAQKKYAAKEYLDILSHLVSIAEAHPELVTSVGLCNFDSAHVEEACEHLLGRLGRVGLVSNQVQFSLLDSRPRRKMASVCERFGIKLLTYGSFVSLFKRMSVSLSLGWLV